MLLYLESSENTIAVTLEDTIRINLFNREINLLEVSVDKVNCNFCDEYMITASWAPYSVTMINGENNAFKAIAIFTLTADKNHYRRFSYMAKNMVSDDYSDWVTKHENRIEFSLLVKVGNTFIPMPKNDLILWTAVIELI